ncbi:MAG TPA: GNAT family N-acetyltransferase [Rhizomicrobium sp.]
MIPRLETERLVLREWRAEDFEPYARFMADSDVTRYLTGEPMSRADAWRNMATFIGHWELRGYGMWAVERKADRAFVGRVGMHNPEGWPGPEVGWTLGKKYWGAGLATEAARAAMAYAFLTQNFDRVISVIQIDNAASQAVAQRLGETRGARHDVVHGGKTFVTDVWSIARADWARSQSA